ncbi:hypothetical protein [Botrimarina sp.]|uniref:hypothetical protein n=1 Tax=Botrimarina sp. TaxID=2795802 RepID=UPI0032EAFA2B
MPTATLKRPAITKQRLSERTLAAPGSVDRTAKVIRGVKIIGTVSRNGRRYTEECLRDAAGLYEGAKVYLDHRKPGGSQSVSAHFGTLRNVRWVPERKAVVGDLHYLASHPSAGPILEAAESQPSAFGLSHDADGDVQRQRGESVVTKIRKVFSVDLVADPATTAGLFESADPGLPVRDDDEARSHCLLAQTPLAKKAIEILKKHGRGGAGLFDELRDLFEGVVAGEPVRESAYPSSQTAFLREIRRPRDLRDLEESRRNSGRVRGRSAALTAYPGSQSDFLAALRG